MKTEIKISRNQFLKIAAAGTAALALAACGGSSSSTASSAASSTAASGSAAASAAQTNIRLGVVGENNEYWTPVINRLADEGVTLELVKFSDYTQPNQALADGEIDLNAFQHYAYLNNEIADKGLDLTVIGETIIAPLGVYSDKISSLDELKDGDSIAIPSDATNGGRALKLLEAGGVITVDPAAGYTPEVGDITDNPKNINFIEVEAAGTAALLPDVAAAVINGGHAVDNGFNPTEDSIFLESVEEGSDNPYINIIVARTEDKDNELYKKVVDYFHSDEVAQVIADVYKGAYIPAWQ